jgi:hypothetical protein
MRPPCAEVEGAATGVAALETVSVMVSVPFAAEIARIGT